MTPDPDRRAHSPRITRGASTTIRRRPASSVRTWRDGSRTARRWNTELIGWAAVCVGAGVLLSVTLPRVIPGTVGSLVGSAALWAGMAVPVAIAFARARPRGLLRFRWTDPLYAVTLGAALRIAQGWLAVAAGESGALPSYALINGQLPHLWWLTALIGPVAIAPLIEEFLFRGVLLVAVYRIARRGLDGGVLALVAATTAFVAVHALTLGVTSWEQPVTWTLLAMTCALLVLLTGRIWGAVLVHIGFNLSGVLLALAGTALG